LLQLKFGVLVVVVLVCAVAVAAFQETLVRILEEPFA
jgi:hypothetical protein